MNIYEIIIALEGKKMAIFAWMLFVVLGILVILITTGYFNYTPKCPYIYKSLVSYNSNIVSLPTSQPVYTTTPTILIPTNSLISYLYLSITVPGILDGDAIIINIWYTDTSGNITGPYVLYNSNDFKYVNGVILFNGYAKKKMASIVTATAPVSTAYTMKFLVKKYSDGNILTAYSMNVININATCMAFMWDSVVI